MSDVLEYKGYQATVDFEDGRIVIQVLHVRDHLTTETHDASKVEAEFHALVDEYLADCEEIGKNPDKQYSGTFNVRIAPDLHKKCAWFAVSRQISLNELVGRALEGVLVEAEAAARTVRENWEAAPEMISQVSESNVVVKLRKTSRSEDEIVVAWGEAIAKERRH
ncbi:type II toxin-antitoxin system HicB family antitoxin [Reyranella sp.]|uniref:type II toxin-antitoxin system HicB family antitoxin n=1 Tax=Reyranella sp. TaxID=1929291 RepID=UPI00403553B1